MSTTIFIAFVFASLLSEYQSESVLLPPEYKVSTLKKILNCQQEKIIPNHEPICSPETYEPCGLICIQKCCPVGMVLSVDFDKEIYKCVDDSGTNWSPYIYKDLKLPILTNSTHLKLHYIPNVPDCPLALSKWTPNLNSPSKFISDFRILDSGRVFKRLTGNHPWREMHYGNFCIDGLISNLEGQGASFIWKSSNQIILECRTSKGFNEILMTPFFKILFGFMCISCFLMFLTSVIYFLLWNKNNVHGWILTMFVSSILLYTVSFTTAFGLFIFQREIYGTPACFGLGVCLHFFCIATFTWLTVLCYDLMTTIRNFTPVPGRSRGTKRFGVYSCFGFGVPLVVVVISLFIESHYSILDDSIIKPQYGLTFCGVGQYAIFYYVYLVPCILFVGNILFGAMIVRALYKHRKEANDLNISNNFKTKREQAAFFAKLIILTGLPWIFRFMLGFLSHIWLGTITNLVQVVQGVGLFWILVCNRKTKKMLLEKYSNFRSYFQFEEEQNWKRTQLQESSI